MFDTAEVKDYVGVHIRTHCHTVITLQIPLPPPTHVQGGSHVWSHPDHTK